MDRMEGKCTMRVTSLGTGEWAIKTICCGYEDTTQFCETWELAEQFRHDYIASKYHDRVAIISKVDPWPRVVDESGRLNVAVFKRCLEYEVGITEGPENNTEEEHLVLNGRHEQGLCPVCNTFTKHHIPESEQTDREPDSKE
jgi:hypothetical protein